AFGAALFDGNAVVVAVRRAQMHKLLLIDLRTGSVMQRMRLDGISGLQVAEQRGYAIVRQGAGTLSALDLRFGRLLWTLKDGHELVDFAVDAAGQTLALEWRDGRDESETVLASLPELIRGGCAFANKPSVAAKPVGRNRAMPNPVEPDDAGSESVEPN